jgi:site-specific DNA-methyltransferase (adenine-specific)
MFELYHGDCLEVMKGIPSGSVDMVLTDPPYGMAFRSNHRAKKYDLIKNDSSLEWLDGFVDEAFRVAADNTAHYVFCSFHHIDVFKKAFQRRFKIKNLLVWEKNSTSMGDLKGDFAPKVEFILFLHKGRRHINGKREPNLMKFARTGNLHHPTEKPVSLCAYLAEKFSDRGGVVLDPFMGSGTTGVACANTGRKFIGIELDENYFNIAKARIEQAHNKAA